MKIFAVLPTAFLVAAVGCQKAEQSPSATTKTSSSGNPITAPVDYLGAVAKAKRASEKTINLTALNSAIQQFNAMEERFPKNLAELVEKRYLPANPTAPAGMKFAYNPQTGEVKVTPQ